MKPLSGRLQQITLTAHVAASVGWLGAVATLAALAIVGLASQDEQTVRAVYLVMEPLGWFLLFPLAIASLLSGLVQSLITTWGLFLHYWVVFKLAINVVATVILLLYMQTLEHLGDLAANASFSSGDLDPLRDPSPLLHSLLALALLLVATTLGVLKPRGLTPYGRRIRGR